MKIQQLLLIFICLLFINISFAQVGRVEHGDRLSSLIDRYEIKYGNYNGFMGLDPKFRSEIYDYFFVLDSVGLSTKEEYDRQYVIQNLAENSVPSVSDTKSWWKYFYENKTYAYSLKRGKFWISANPIIYLKGGLEKNSIDEKRNIVLQNTRGIRIKGALGEKIYFSSAIYENQAAFQSYHKTTINRFETIPGNAFYKEFDFNIKNQSYDYLNADGFVGVRINSFSALELGHGTHFIGHGIRSLLLSNHATNYFYLRANTKVWKFNYQNLFAELAPFTEKLLLLDNVLMPKKYMAQHLISFKLNSNIELGVFETVIFSRPDHFEFQYLNPIIFYRTVEQFLNSTDNSILGAQAKINLFSSIQLYGQFLLDEFDLSALREDWNYNGNKFGIQAGFKWIDVFEVDHLDIQVEFNSVRPYTYSHDRKYGEYTFRTLPISPTSYSHFSQALAHPLGANFVEFMFNSSYKINNKLSVYPRALFTIQGVDSLKTNFGSNILINNSVNNGLNDQFLLQGERVSVLLVGLNTSYEVFPNYFIDLNFQYRNSVSLISEYADKSLYFGAGIRFNFTETPRDY